MNGTKTTEKIVLIDADINIIEHLLFNYTPHFIK